MVPIWREKPQTLQTIYRANERIRSIKLRNWAWAVAHPACAQHTHITHRTHCCSLCGVCRSLWMRCNKANSGFSRQSNHRKFIPLVELASPCMPVKFTNSNSIWCNVVGAYPYQSILLLFLLWTWRQRRFIWAFRLVFLRNYFSRSLFLPQPMLSNNAHTECNTRSESIKQRIMRKSERFIMNSINWENERMKERKRILWTIVALQLNYWRQTTTQIRLHDIFVDCGGIEWNGTERNGTEQR